MFSKVKIKILKSYKQTLNQLNKKPLTKIINTHESKTATKNSKVGRVGRVNQSEMNETNGTASFLGKYVIVKIKDPS